MQFVRESEKEGNGSGRGQDRRQGKPRRQAPVLGKGREEGKPEETSLPEVPNPLFDTIATAVDVDSTVTRFADSAAPVYRRSY